MLTTNLSWDDDLSLSTPVHAAYVKFDPEAHGADILRIGTYATAREAMDVFRERHAAALASGVRTEKFTGWHRGGANWWYGDDPVLVAPLMSCKYIPVCETGDGYAHCIFSQDLNDGIEWRDDCSETDSDDWKTPNESS